MTEPVKNGLTAVAQKFILHWGEMGTRWGINRTVAQVHALLFLSRIRFRRMKSPRRWRWRGRM